MGNHSVFLLLYSKPRDETELDRLYRGSSKGLSGACWIGRCEEEHGTVEEFLEKKEKVPRGCMCFVNHKKSFIPSHLKYALQPPLPFISLTPSNVHLLCFLLFFDPFECAPLLPFII